MQRLASVWQPGATRSSPGMTGHWYSTTGKRSIIDSRANLLKPKSANCASANTPITYTPKQIARVWSTPANLLWTSSKSRDTIDRCFPVGAGEERRWGWDACIAPVVSFPTFSRRGGGGAAGGGGRLASPREGIGGLGPPPRGKNPFNIRSAFPPQLNVSGSPPP